MSWRSPPFDAIEITKLAERLPAVTHEPTVNATEDVEAVAVDRALDPGARERDDLKVIALRGAGVVGVHRQYSSIWAASRGPFFCVLNCSYQRSPRRVRLLGERPFEEQPERFRPGRNFRPRATPILKRPKKRPLQSDLDRGARFCGCHAYASRVAPMHYRMEYARPATGKDIWRGRTQHRHNK